MFRRRDRSANSILSVALALLLVVLYLTVMTSPDESAPVVTGDYGFVLTPPAYNLEATCEPGSNCAFLLLPHQDTRGSLLNISWVLENASGTPAYWNDGIRIIEPALDSSDGVPLVAPICIDLNALVLRAVRIRDIHYDGTPSATLEPMAVITLIHIGTQTPVTPNRICETATAEAEHATQTATFSVPTYVPTATPIRTATTGATCLTCTATPNCPSSSEPCPYCKSRGFNPPLQWTPTVCAGCPGANEYKVDWSCYGCGYSSFQDFRDQILGLAVATQLHGWYRGTPNPTQTAGPQVRWMHCSEDDGFGSPSVNATPKPGGNSPALSTACPPVRLSTPVTTGICAEACGLYYEGSGYIVLRDYNPDTMLHEMFHAWYKSRYNQGQREQFAACVRPVLETWLTKCGSATPPPGPSGPDTHKDFCKIWGLKARAYVERDGGLFSDAIEELLATIAGLASSCDRLACSVWLPPEILGTFKDFLQ